MKNFRKVVGLIVLIVLLIVYSFAAMQIAVNFLPESRWAELVYYPLVGVIWIFPAMKIVKWMQQSDNIK